jgi:hypothetical protein
MFNKVLSRFRTPKQQRSDNMEVVHKRVARNQEAVYRAVERLKHPVTCRTISRYMDTDSACVSPRLTELVRKGRLAIAYRKQGLDHIWRAYYVIAK